MKSKLVACAALLPLSGLAQGDSVPTEPVGAVTIHAAAEGDTPLTLPLARYSVSSGRVKSLSGNVLTVATKQNSAARELPQGEAHYIRFLSGSASGRHYTITAYTPEKLTIDLNGETVTLAEGDAFSVSPYWTLGSILPSDQAGQAFSASASPRQLATTIWLRSGGNTAPEGFYFFNGAWRKVGASSEESYNSYPVHPDASLVMRNRGTASSFVVTGTLSSVASKVVINANGGGERQDNELSLGFPGPITLSQTNLVQGGAFEASTSTVQRGDELRVFTTTAGIQHVSTYFYYKGAWRKVGAPLGRRFDDEPVFADGTRVVLSKAGTGAEPKTVYWTQPKFALN